MNDDEIQDAIREAIYDGTSDGEGRLTVSYLITHLRKQGLKIVSIACDEARAAVARRVQSEDRERQNRIGTHWVGCHTEGGPRHYDCLLREYHKLKSDGEDVAQMLVQRDKEADAALEAAQARIAALEGHLRAFLHMIKPDADDLECGRTDALEGLPDSHCFELTWAPEARYGHYITAGQIRRAARALGDTK